MIYNILSSGLDTLFILGAIVGFALMTLVIYFRYSKFRISSAFQIRDLRKKLDTETEERKVIENNLLVATENSNQKTEALLRELNSLRREKESEANLRFEAEKQIELALQRTEEIQKRMQDWRVVQDAVMKDSKDAIVKLGNDLFKKMSDNYKVEAETSRNLIGRIPQGVAELLEKNPSAKKSSAATAPKAETHVLDSDASHSSTDDIVKKLTSDLHNTMKANGHFVNKNYFLPSNFDAEKAKSFLCEISYIKEDRLYIMDFKACRYLEEYKNLKAKNSSESEAVLKQKIDKYIAYLSNQKYRESILKVMASTKAKFAGEIMIVAVSSKEDLKILKELRYYEQFRKLDFEVMDFDEVNSMVL